LSFSHANKNNRVPNLDNAEILLENAKNTYLNQIVALIGEKQNINKYLIT